MSIKKTEAIGDPEVTRVAPARRRRRDDASAPAGDSLLALSTDRFCRVVSVKDLMSSPNLETLPSHIALLIVRGVLAARAINSKTLRALERRFALKGELDCEWGRVLKREYPSAYVEEEAGGYRRAFGRAKRERSAKRAHGRMLLERSLASSKRQRRTKIAKLIVSKQRTRKSATF